jgi:hypothetical protein
LPMHIPENLTIFLDPKAYIVVIINLCSLGFEKGYDKKDICH